MLRMTAVAAVRKIPLFKKSRAASGACAKSWGEDGRSTPILKETATMIVKLAYPTNLDRKFGVARRRDLRFSVHLHLRSKAQASPC